MQSPFDEMIDRSFSGSMKWTIKDGELPMWVADMDFQTAPVIKEALAKRVEHGVFGYHVVSDEWYDSIITWWKNRHHVTFEKEWLIFCTGVVPAISSIVRRMTSVHENILVLTPVYNIFFNSIKNNGREVVEHHLTYDNGSYQIDFEQLELQLSNPQTTMMIFCNPHNPTGNLWDRETLMRIGELCYKHHVLVVSDEIHCDLCDPGYEYVAFSSVSEICAQNSITCIAPTKAFNIAGLQTAAVVIPNPYIRARVERGLNTDEIAEPNAFAIEASVAAFTKGEAWLKELNQYIYENKKFVQSYLHEQLPAITIIESHATYLLWLDCHRITENAKELAAWIRNTTGLILSEGEQYGSNGFTFLRMNVACPKARVEDGLQRLVKGINSYLIEIKNE